MDLLVKVNKLKTESDLSGQEIASLLYHDIFEYPLTLAELIKWQSNSAINHERLATSYKNGFYFLKGREGIVYKRLLKKRISEKKLEIARKAGLVLSLIPTVKMVGVTGALAMESATEESDIDLIIIAKNGTLWTTRLLAYLSFIIFHLPLRRPKDSDQRDKLCLNMWLDEVHPTWPKKDRNIYTAHEIAQILPLVNKDETYERFLWKNRWLLEFWPNSIKILRGRDRKNSPISQHPSIMVSVVEKLAFNIQYHYMKGRITREVVTPTRAIFHPNDWGKIVLARLHLDKADSHR